MIVMQMRLVGDLRELGISEETNYESRMKILAS